MQRERRRALLPESAILHADTPCVWQRTDERSAPAYKRQALLPFEGDIQLLTLAHQRRPTKPQPDPMRRILVLAGAGCALAAWASPPPAAPAQAGVMPGDDLSAWTEQFQRVVDRRLDVPAAERQRYFDLLQQALRDDELTSSADPVAQAFVLIDRSPQVQAACIVVRTPANDWHWIGAAAVSTGKTGSFEHFLTPLGVFAHSLDNPDFRAEGSFNKNHIRGYGLRGRRVFDFGWQSAERGWGKGGVSRMRLQMHATDPDVLEPRLGRVASEGCIRIPATLNVFLDRHGILDADYEEAIAGGQALWVIRPSRQTIPWPGRYMVIVDSGATERPPWSPLPGAKASAPSPSAGRTESPA